MQEVCTAAVRDDFMRLDPWDALSIVPGAWSVMCAG